MQRAYSSNPIKYAWVKIEARPLISLRMVDLAIRKSRLPPFSSLTA